jgi:hypothetical protein
MGIEHSKGFWSDRDANSGNSEHEHMVLMDAQKTIEILSNLFLAFNTCEESINKVSKALDISQPPINGRISIRWWSLGSKYKDPIFVRWRIRPDAKGFNFAPLKRVKPNTGEKFEINSFETSKLIDIGKSLINERKQLRQRMIYIQRKLTGISNVVPYVKTLGTDADELRIMCGHNLVEAGFDVEPHIFDEPSYD